MSKLGWTSILVTGADGFVGRSLVPELRRACSEEARFLLPSRNDIGPDAFDLTDAKSVGKTVAAARPDLVIHLAAQSSVGSAGRQAEQTWRTNVVGTLNLAAAVAENAPNATFLFVSSSEVYGAAFKQGPVNEDCTPLPQSVYGKTKLAAEMALTDMLPSTTQLIIVRPANHSGPGQDERFVIPAFAAQIAACKSEPAPVINVGNLDAKRDFLDLRDVCAAYIALLRQAPELGSRNLFNLASGQAIAIGEILNRLIALSGSRPEIRQDADRMRPSEIPIAEIDATRLRNATGWHPEHSLDEMLSDILNFERNRIGR